MFPVNFIGHQFDARRWAIPLNVDLAPRLYPGRYQVYVSLLCLHLAFSVFVARQTRFNFPSLLPRNK